MKSPDPASPHEKNLWPINSRIGWNRYVINENNSNVEVNEDKSERSHKKKWIVKKEWFIKWINNQINMMKRDKKLSTNSTNSLIHRGQSSYFNTYF